MMKSVNLNRCRATQKRSFENKTYMERRSGFGLVNKNYRYGEAKIDSNPNWEMIRNYSFSGSPR